MDAAPRGATPRRDPARRTSSRSARNLRDRSPAEVPPDARSPRGTIRPTAAALHDQVPARTRWRSPRRLAADPGARLTRGPPKRTSNPPRRAGARSSPAPSRSASAPPASALPRPPTSSAPTRPPSSSAAASSPRPTSWPAPRPSTRPTAPPRRSPATSGAPPSPPPVCARPRSSRSQAEGRGRQAGRAGQAQAAAKAERGEERQRAIDNAKDEPAGRRPGPHGRPRLDERRAVQLPRQPLDRRERLALVGREPELRRVRHPAVPAREQDGEVRLPTTAPTR